MTSGLGKGLDKSIRDAEETLGLEEEKPEERKLLSPADEEIFRDYVDRMMATAIVDGPAQDGPVIITDQDLMIECRWWLYARGLFFGRELGEIIRRSEEYHVRKDVEKYLSRIWHIGGPSYKESLVIGNYADPTGKGVWTKAYLEAFLRLREGDPLPPEEHSDVCLRSMKYWNLQTS